MFRKLTLFVFAILWSLSCTGQQPVFRQYSVDEGLPSSEVYHAVQDPKGYIWFATDRGISRFDGSRFKIYTSENGLKANTVFKFQFDHKNRMWFRSFSGQPSYLHNDTIHTIDLGSYSNGNPRDYLRSFHMDKGDTLWYSSESDKKIYYYTEKDKKSVLWNHRGSPFDSHFYFAGEGSHSIPHPKDSIELSGWSIGRHFSYCSRVYYDKRSISPMSLRNDEVHCIRLADGSFLGALSNSLFGFSSGGVLFEKQYDKNVIWMSQDSENTIWIGFFKGGVRRYTSMNDIEESFRSSKDQQKKNHFLKNVSVSSVLRDSEGGLWFTTLESGVFYTQSTAPLCYTVHEGLNDNKITCMALRKPGEIYAGTHGGGLFLVSEKGVKKIPMPSEYSGTYTTASLFISRQNGTTWYCSQKGVFEIDNATNRVRLIIPKLFVKSSFEISRNEIWMGDLGSILKFRGTRMVEKSDYDTPFFLRVHAICEYENEVWVGSLNGLYTFSRDFRYRGADHPLFRTRVMDLKKSESRMWIATLGAGVLLKQKDTVIQISSREGLAFNLCTSVFLDGDSTGWVCTNKGISKITFTDASGKNYRIKNYTTRNGLPSNEVNSVLRDGDYLWIATNKGLARLNTVNEEPNSTPPPVYLTGTRVNNIDTTLKDNQTLGYSSNTVSFRFTGISFRHSGAMSYKYHLTGVDKGWRYTSQQEVLYSNLAPGSYRFLVYAVNGDGTESRKPATLEFTVLPAWWDTWWFRVSIIIALGSLITSIYLTRMRIERRKGEEKVALNKRIAQTELKALQAQMNPHFIFNSLNSIQKFIVRNDAESAHRYLSKFGSLVRTILHNSSRAFLPLADEIHSLELYLQLESLRLEHNFDYKLDIDPSIEVHTMMIPAMIIQPYVENAIWHGIMPLPHKGRLDLSFRLKGEALLCTIRDNGIGRKKSAELRKERQVQHQSKGMKITEDRLNILALTEDLASTININDIDEDGITGTVVQLILPVKYIFSPYENSESSNR